VAPGTSSALERTSLAAAWKFARVIKPLRLLAETVGQGLGGHDVVAALQRLRGLPPCKATTAPSSSAPRRTWGTALNDLHCGSSIRDLADPASYWLAVV
jgi:hypothetical protein